MTILDKILTKFFNRLNNKLYPYHFYAKKSFSQCGEDIIINHIFQQLNIEKPSYIDIGAHHPYYLNNTAFFYLKGSTGINIEPDPTLFAEFEKSRVKDINLNVGIGIKNSECDFYIMSEPTLNTFVKAEAEKANIENPLYTIKDVKLLEIKTLQYVLDTYNNAQFPDFLSLDVEGLDEVIISNINFEIYKPKVICVETISFSNNGNGIKNTKIIELLESKGYMVYADTNINTIFVDAKLWKR